MPAHPGMPIMPRKRFVNKTRRQTLRRMSETRKHAEVRIPRLMAKNARQARIVEKKFHKLEAKQGKLEIKMRIAARRGWFARVFTLKRHPYTYARKLAIVESRKNARALDVRYFDDKVAAFEGRINSLGAEMQAGEAKLAEIERMLGIRPLEETKPEEQKPADQKPGEKDGEAKPDGAEKNNAQNGMPIDPRTGMPMDPRMIQYFWQQFAMMNAGLHHSTMPGVMWAFPQMRFAPQQMVMAARYLEVMYAWKWIETMNMLRAESLQVQRMRMMMERGQAGAEGMQEGAREIPIEEKNTGAEKVPVEVKSQKTEMKWDWMKKENWVNIEVGLADGKGSLQVQGKILGYEKSNETGKEYILIKTLNGDIRKISRGSVLNGEELNPKEIEAAMEEERAERQNVVLGG